ncbi:SDR family NAD(P)-dependent oxidoreductase [Guyparkeria hydrothermalis]|uniref:SDR family NAD(P)-dependent oxidoreductase n=1 Tax=Guyparkeria hydrothermalis TaxID=923 RepID=UPI002020BDD6|nr:SDR family NAD(P)-dependent oxidoreductase [Guyparkeria hydrothermalis]MCL7743495.1 SDR family NAD(P)-dependent oxidoreductase [Guyparkeria hydrothermalis]
MTDSSAPDTSFAGQVVLINGASGALGTATAQTLAARGATLILLGRKLDQLERLADDIVDRVLPDVPDEARGEPPLIQPVDFSGAAPEDYEQLITGIEQAFGRLDLLVHAMGTAGELAPLAHAELMKFQESLHVNLTAPFALTRACWPLLERSKQPRVLFFTDRGTEAFGSAHDIAHAGLERMIHQWAAEAPQVWITGFDPGAVNSRLRHARFPGELAEDRQPPCAVMPALLDWLEHGESGAIQRLADSSASD